MGEGSLKGCFHTGAADPPRGLCWGYPSSGMVQAGWLCQRQVSWVSHGSLEAHGASFQLLLWREGASPSRLVPTVPTQDSRLVICRAAGTETLWNAEV